MNSLINQSHLLISMNQALNRLSKSIAEEHNKLNSLESKMNLFETKLNYIDSIIDRTVNIPQPPPPSSLQLQVNQPSEERIKIIVDESVDKSIKKILASLKPQSYVQLQPHVQEDPHLSKPTYVSPVYDPTPPLPLSDDSLQMSPLDLNDLNLNDLNSLDNFSSSLINVDQEDDIIIMNSEQASSKSKPKKRTIKK